MEINNKEVPGGRRESQDQNLAKGGKNVSYPPVWTAAGGMRYKSNLEDKRDAI